MAASTSGALKAYIESLSLGISVFRDRAPENQALPYIVVREGIDISPETAFNQNDDDEGHVEEQVQLDVWEQWKDSTGHIDESYTLGDELTLALKSAVLDGPTHVSGVRILSAIRIPDVDANRIRKTITLGVRRVLARPGS